MTAIVRKWFCATVLGLASYAAPVWSATVTVLPTGPTGGTTIGASVDDFERLGKCGYGNSVVNDGCSVVSKSDPTAPDAFGRFDPSPAGYWIDSQDTDVLKWTVSSSTAFSTLIFAVTDAYDQKGSHFTMSYKDAGQWKSIWDIPSQLTSGNLFWLMVDFGKQVTSADLRFSTMLNDGYGISGVSIESPAPVPVPPAALMLLTGPLLLSLLRRRRKAA